MSSHASRQHGGAAPSLSLAALEQLASHAHLKAGYPHIWEPIRLFCNDPAHLDKYLASLSTQDRAGKRDGLHPEAMIEIIEIRAANQRFLAPSSAGTVWDEAAFKR